MMTVETAPQVEAREEVFSKRHGNDEDYMNNGDEQKEDSYPTPIVDYNYQLFKQTFFISSLPFASFALIFCSCF